MRKISILSLVALLFLVSCKKNIHDLNEEPKKPTDVPPASLFSNAQKNYMDIMTSSNVNRNIFRLVAQEWTQTTYTDETRFDLATRAIPQNFWNILYRDVLANLAEADRLIPGQSATQATEPQKKNQQAIAKVMKVYSYFVLIATFGDIPYTQALDISNVHPKYDDAKTAYYALADELDAAMAGLNANEPSFGEQDLFYEGDVAKWIKFGNSLKLKMALLLSDVDAAKAKTMAEAAAPKVFSSNADNAIIQYKASPPNTNPIWVDLVQSGRQDFVAAQPFVDSMKKNSDPRLPFYFTLDATDTTYSGGVVGKGNTYSIFSKPSAKVVKADFEALALDYAEVEFTLAEAAARGFNVGGTAQSHYNNAITASILYWGGTQASVDAYVAKPSVAYATASGTPLQRIALQKWFALYNRGFEAWTSVRQFDYPVLKAPVDAKSAFPVRYTYPVQEQNLNTANYNAAAAAIGGDKVTTKLFWDKF